MEVEENMGNDFSKLPKWAQEKIKQLERERQVAIDALNAALDNETPSPFYVESCESTGEGVGPQKKIRYVQAYKMTVKWMGVILNIMTCKGDGQRLDGIELSWENENIKSLCHGVGAIPTGFNKICIPAQTKGD